MGLMQPTLPDVDPARWPQLGRLERIRELAPFWVDHGFGTQRVVHLLYVGKCVLYAGGAVLVTAWTTPGLGGVANVGHWWSEPVFFQKAVILTLLFEVLGLGCGFGTAQPAVLPAARLVPLLAAPRHDPAAAVAAWVPLTRGDPRTVGRRRSCTPRVLAAGSAAGRRRPRRTGAGRGWSRWPCCCR